jgi:hypothetical protein
VLLCSAAQCRTGRGPRDGEAGELHGHTDRPGSRSIWQCWENGTEDGTELGQCFCGWAVITSDPIELRSRDLGSWSQWALDDQRDASGQAAGGVLLTNKSRASKPFPSPPPQTPTCSGDGFLPCTFAE